MKKLLTTIALALGLLFGGTVALAAPAVAEDCQIGSPCTPPSPEPQPCPVGGCVPEPCPQIGACVGGGSAVYNTADVVELEQTANDYRAQIVALTAQVERQTARADRLQRVADRRAETISRLRAKIRALR